VRVCVAGGGLAGSLLAWRLAQLPGTQVDLLTGPAGGTGIRPIVGGTGARPDAGGTEVRPAADATAASGGAVRAYDALAAQRRLAIASLAELLGSRVLRDWARYRETGFAYLREDGTHLAAELAEIERELPGSADLTSPAEAFGARDGGPGWAGDQEEVVIRERRAGVTSPAHLRDAVVADLAARPGARVRDGVLDGLTAGAYDAVVLAAGAWTPGLLRALGLPAQGYRTRSIQYTVYDAGPVRPTAFADERTGLYGLPTADGGMLIGLPTTQWDVPAGPGAVTGVLHERAARVAAACLPRLKLGQARHRVAAADCFCDPPVLALRPADGPLPGLFTFTGGSGGCAKTALAASQRAALQLTEAS
jgi:glycine/D-amino acid oxidase-like deaminating enzyme